MGACLPLPVLPLCIRFDSSGSCGQFTRCWHDFSGKAADLLWGLLLRHEIERVEALFVDQFGHNLSPDRGRGADRLVAWPLSWPLSGQRGVSDRP